MDAVPGVEVAVWDQGHAGPPDGPDVEGPVRQVESPDVWESAEGLRGSYDA